MTSILLTWFDTIPFLPFSIYIGHGNDHYVGLVYRSIQVCMLLTGFYRKGPSACATKAALGFVWGGSSCGCMTSELCFRFP